PAPVGAARAGARVVPRDPVAVLVHGRQPRDVAAPDPTGAVVVRAPMQGTIVAVDVSAGDAVPDGAQLLVMEAMKMEHVVVAPVGGIVRAVHVAPGETVYEAAALLTLEESAVEAAADVETGRADLEHVRPDLS